MFRLLARLPCELLAGLALARLVFVNNARHVAVAHDQVAGVGAQRQQVVGKRTHHMSDSVILGAQIEPLAKRKTSC